MNGKAVACFALSALCTLGAIGYFNDGVRAMRGDVWPDAVRYSPNGETPEAGNVRVVDKETAE
jgi:hypothetical protein